MDVRIISYDKNMCRLCLSSNEELLSVFDENYKFLSQRIAECVNIEVLKTDKLPNSICKQCYMRVQDWYDFKMCCEKAQYTLNNWAEGKNIKQEIESDPEDPVQVVEPACVLIKSEIHDSYDGKEKEVEKSNNASSSSESCLVPAVVHGIDSPIYRQAKNSISCRVCFKKFTRKSNRVRHERSQHSISAKSTDIAILTPEGLNVPVREIITRKFQCQVCCKIFLDNEVLLEHLKTHSTLLEQEEVPFVECKYCKKTFLTSAGLANHLKSHELDSGAEQTKTRVEPSEGFQCIFCSMDFESRTDLAQHMKIHLNGTCKCTFCPKVCANNSALIQHIRHRHTFKRPAIKSNLQKNGKPRKRIKCKKCSKFLPTPQALSRHLKNNCLYCASCNKPFTTVNAFETHKDQHIRNKKFRCKKCKIDFPHYSDYKEHLNKLHRTHQCQYCQKMFLYPKTLYKHCRIFHGDEEDEETIQNLNSDSLRAESINAVRLYKCTECNKNFSNAKSLRLHVLLHPKSST